MAIKMTRTNRHVTIDVEVYKWLAEQADRRRFRSLGRVIDDLVADQHARTGENPYLAPAEPNATLGER